MKAKLPKPCKIFKYKFKLNFKLSVKENAYFLFSEKKQEICNTENSVEESVSAKPTQIKAKDTNNFCIKRNVNLKPTSQQDSTGNLLCTEPW